MTASVREVCIKQRVSKGTEIFWCGLTEDFCMVCEFSSYSWNALQPFGGSALGIANNNSSGIMTVDVQGLCRRICDGVLCSFLQDIVKSNSSGIVAVGVPHDRGNC